MDRPHLPSFSSSLLCRLPRRHPAWRLCLDRDERACSQQQLPSLAACHCGHNAHLLPRSLRHLAGHLQVRLVLSLQHERGSGEEIQRVATPCQCSFLASSRASVGWTAGESAAAEAFLHRPVKGVNVCRGRELCCADNWLPLRLSRGNLWNFCNPALQSIPSATSQVVWSGKVEETLLRPIRLLLPPQLRTSAGRTDSDHHEGRGFAPRL